MGRKKPAPEHENLERWLVSYADFITLLFATFVVLYALSQIDISEFTQLEEGMKKAFSAPSILSGDNAILPESGDSILDASSGDAVVAPLMLEYISQKYEEESYNQIEKAIGDLTKKGELDGVNAEITDKGLLITFKDDMLFYSGSATLNEQAMETLDKVGVLISEKFALHYMRIEGHTDNTPISSILFPSNWELSSARASAMIRYLSGRFKFMPNLFSAIGYADTRPIVDNSTSANRAKNRRVEILILKNKYRYIENPKNDIIKRSKSEQEQFQSQRMEAVKRVRNLSDAAESLTGNNPVLKDNAVILNSPDTNSTLFNTQKNKPAKTLSIKNKTLYEQSTITQNENWIIPPMSNDFDKELDQKFNSIGQ